MLELNFYWTNLGTQEIKRIRLAGAFGSYINPNYAMVLGLIPDCQLECSF